MKSKTKNHYSHSISFSFITVLLACLLFTGCGSSSSDDTTPPTDDTPAVIQPIEPEPLTPADLFDLSYWNITLPIDENNNGSADSIDVAALASYSHPDFFYLDENNYLVFASPNKATTTSTSSNTRSELRQMLRGSDTSMSTSGTGNNFALAAHDDAQDYISIGSSMAATLKVDHVALEALYSEKYPAYSVVVGQIHALKFDTNNDDRIFGWGNEPLKIYFKKYPEHNKGSVFWTYERNLATDDPDRTDIAYPVWGNTWENSSEPGDTGIALGEVFSYQVNVHENTLYLTFQADNHLEVNYSINLADNVDAYGDIDHNDNSLGYSGDPHYFKAGAYNQCSTSSIDGFWYTGCAGTGDWATDKANGDYAQVTFLSLTQGAPQSP